MMPKANENLIDFLKKWMYVKNEVYGGEAGLQLSINSTDDVARDKMFRGSSLSLREIAKIADELPVPVGRKITLNFAIGDWPIDGWTLKKLFDPAKFLCKLTPLHRTKAVNAKGLMPAGDWTSYTPYAAIEQDLKNFGFDVIVFIASAEEDSSRITCGNALLALPEYANKH
jgi:23S rRNA (adenine2503-C2)-methyltransferase